MSRPRLFSRKLHWYLILAACFGMLMVGAFVGGASDIALVSLVVTALALRGALRTRRATAR